MAKVSPKYIDTGRPSITIPAKRDSIEGYLRRGWFCQPKIDGWHIQTHISETGKMIPFTRSKNPLDRGFPFDLKQDIKECFKAEKGWTVVEGEWVKSASLYFLFDLIVLDGDSMAALPYKERLSRIPETKGGKLSKIITCYEIESAMQLMTNSDALVEGIVLRDPMAVGFSASAMRRCRKAGHRHSNRLV